MTVALVGAGIHPSNCSPTPPVYDDGTFEYVPAAESRGSRGTSERRTFGNTRLRHQDRVIADFLDTVWPRGEDGPEVSGVQLADWPLHYDPNFQARSYGASGENGEFVDVLRQLESGDAVAFYAALEPEGGGATHRYLIGHFVVDDVVDFRDVDGDRVSDLSPGEQRQLFDEYADNAHAKRFEASGEPPDDDDLVIVEGTGPGTLLEEAVQISEHGGGGHYYLTDDLQDEFSPVGGGDDDKNAYLGGDYQAHLLDVSPAEFREVLD